MPIAVRWKGKGLKMYPTEAEQELRNWQKMMKIKRNRFPNCIGKKFFPECPETLENIDLLDFKTFPRDCRLCPLMDRGVDYIDALVDKELKKKWRKIKKERGKDNGKEE